MLGKKKKSPCPSLSDVTGSLRQNQLRVCHKHLMKADFSSKHLSCDCFLFKATDDCFACAFIKFQDTDVYILKFTATVSTLSRCRAALCDTNWSGIYCGQSRVEQICCTNASKCICLVCALWLGQRSRIFLLNEQNLKKVSYSAPPSWRHTCLTFFVNLGVLISTNAADTAFR